MTSNDRNARYEATANRRQSISIRSNKNDNDDEWREIVIWLKELGDGKAKEGLYRLAKKNKVI